MSHLESNLLLKLLILLLLFLLLLSLSLLLFLLLVVALAAVAFASAREQFAVGRAANCAITALLTTRACRDFGEERQAHTQGRSTTRSPGRQAKIK